ncbi:sulfurtransferase complex subunit TusC [Bisgaardia hudsonensis]|uniref:sulfurtransferase complex subunit TusC n=1 Tax=Bisgaardia hudsonensis TaxID=109472 RepID=UPI00159DE7F0|nr:sulfurtransferase complex subunit TusC [Bisgaardia hudsonensis]
MKLAFIFRQAPYGSSISREGIDTLLAATAFCNEDEIAVFFIDDGIFNLIANQNPTLILQKDFTQSLKLLDLYDIENRYICENTLQQYGLDDTDFILSCKKIDRSSLIKKVKLAEKVLTF